MDSENPLDSPVKPLSRGYAGEGEASLNEALRYQSARGGEEEAARFFTLLISDLDQLCQSVAEEIAQGGRPAALPDEEASIYLARPTYKHRLETAKRRARRSSAGLWYVYYYLSNESGRGAPDTLSIALIRHSGAAPLTAESSDPEDDSAE